MLFPLRCVRIWSLMLELGDSRWADLGHAYGRASDIPGLLLELKTTSRSSGREEPWFTLWSSLAHQGDVYPASFAAVPHVVDVLARDPTAVDSSFFQFPAWVEICRQRKSVPIPDYLSIAYFLALRRLPALVAAAATQEWDDAFLCCALSSIAAAKGHIAIAESVLEISTPIAEEFLEWFQAR
jgi:hypothetical protein